MQINIMGLEQSLPINQPSLSCSHTRVGLGSILESSRRFTGVAISLCDSCQFQVRVTVLNKPTAPSAEGAAKSVAEARLRQKGDNPGVNCCWQRFR